VRPARAHSCGWKSHRKLIRANEAKRNCMKEPECGGSVERNCEPMDKNRIEGVAEQGERAKFRKALVIKAKWRKSGGCAVKECVLTRGDLASCLKGRRGNAEREVIHGRPRLPSPQSMTEIRLRLRPYIRTLNEANASVPDGIRWTAPRSAERTQWCFDFYGFCRPRSYLFLPSRRECLCNRWRFSFRSLLRRSATVQGFPWRRSPVVPL
jgi:hypothetical protein